MKRNQYEDPSKKMLSLTKALHLVVESAGQLPAEELAIEQSAGHILAEEIISGVNLPPFNKALMDGYAVRAAEIKKNSLLRCVGSIKAGEAPSLSLSIGHRECVKIMTGAEMPLKTDSVVPIEDTERKGDNIIFKISALEPKANVSFLGSVLKANQKVFKKGTLLAPAQVALLAAIGKKKVVVTKKPRVGIINTGEEIVSPGEKIKKNQIYNINGPLLLSLLSEDKIEPAFLGIVKDDRPSLISRIKDGLIFDILLITGGVSMGDYDLVPDVLKSLQVNPIFHKVSIKPGKPVFLGKRKKCLVFGLPGNPLSAFINYHLFVKTAIKKMRGYQDCLPVFAKGRLNREYANTERIRQHFVPVKIMSQGTSNILDPIKTGGSSDVLSLAQAKGFMRVNPSRKKLPKGTIIDFLRTQGD